MSATSQSFQYTCKLPSSFVSIFRSVPKLSHHLTTLCTRRCCSCWRWYRSSAAGEGVIVDDVRGWLSSSGAPEMTSFFLRRFGRPVIDAKNDWGRGEGTRKDGEGVPGEGSGSVGCGGDPGDMGRSAICSFSASRGGRGGEDDLGDGDSPRRGDSRLMYGFSAKTGESSSSNSSGMHDGEPVPKGSVKSDECMGSIGVGRAEADDALDELDDKEGACCILGGIVKEGREECVVDWWGASRESTRRMCRSATSVDPRGVLGGGKSLVTEPERPRLDIKLSKRSRFLVLLTGDAGTASRAPWMMRGRDATESSDQRDAKPGSASSRGLCGLSTSTGESVIASPGVTASSNSGVTTVESEGELLVEKDGDGVDANSASLRSCGDDAEVDSVGNAGRCFLLGLELNERELLKWLLLGTVALQLRPRPTILGMDSAKESGTLLLSST